MHIQKKNWIISLVKHDAWNRPIAAWKSVLFVLLNTIPKLKLEYDTLYSKKISSERPSHAVFQLGLFDESLKNSNSSL